MAITFDIRDEFSPMLKKINQRVANPSGVTPTWIKLMQKSVAEEFSSKSWKHMSGGRRPWKPILNPFGTRPSHSPLVLSGRLLKEWTTGGESGKSEAKISARSSAAIVHRGGQDTVRQKITKTPKRGGQAAKDRMFAALKAKFGVSMTALLSGHSLEIPSRPHATRNPELEIALRDATAEFFVNGSR